MDAARLAMGQHALHLPINLIGQQLDRTGERFAGVFQFEHPGGAKLFEYTDEAPHVLVVADMFIRPQLRLRTDKLKGFGISGVYRDGFVGEHWQGSEKLFDLMEALGGDKL